MIARTYAFISRPEGPVLARSSRPSVLCAVAALSLLFACDDAVVQPEADPGPAETGEPTQSADGPLAELSRGLALALDDAPLRQRMLEDMRDSPFPEHSLPLQDYLASEGGRDLAAAAARELGISAEELHARLEEQQDLQIFMPSILQRGLWKGEGPVTVVAASSREVRSDAGTYSGWNSAGGTVQVNPARVPDLSTFAVIPAQPDFGGGPSPSLEAARTRDRATIGPKGVLPVHGAGGERSEGGLGDLGAAAVSDGGGFAPGEGGLSDWVSWDTCRVATNDHDRDGLIDTCEQQLAKAFRPQLNFHPQELYESRETYWAVRVQDFERRYIFIFYALGYHDDRTHVGDSEWIQLRVVYENGRWKLLWADYSAHFGSILFFDESQTYHHSELFYADRDRGRPEVVVAKGKHAAYNNLGSCITSWDECERGFVQDVDVDPSRNLGGMYGQTEPLENCVTSEKGVAADGHALPGTECIWTGLYFDGWHSSSEETTSYEEVLEYFNWKTRTSGVGDPGDCRTDGPILQPVC